VTGPETVTGWTVPGDQPITVTLESRNWEGFFRGWEVFVGARWVGLIGGYEYPQRFRGYGYGSGLDGRGFDDFDTRAEAVQWLLDGYLTRAES
jgi:hypothetical protein